MYVNLPAFTVTGIKYEGYDLKDPRQTANWACYGCTNAYWRVRNAQWLIWEFGYSQQSAIDGYWGWNTYRDVCTFQHFSGLTKDGIVGLNTWNELNTTGTRNPYNHWDHQNCP